eukprot:TRINITY_DN8230_c2_g1_i3.p1 TRINITY_DN8230_c2_g1~~TRINITY_DN8230_c2_g1_i3.p1  ORF type:complete len:336 (-),score=69.12 TRINITY_DN8230_c2_g1_i3:147-1154(-)
MSAGLLFAVATLDLIPEAIAAQNTAVEVSSEIPSITWSTADEVAGAGGVVDSTPPVLRSRVGKSGGSLVTPALPGRSRTLHAHAHAHAHGEGEGEGHEHGHGGEGTQWAMMGLAGGFLLLLAVEQTMRSLGGEHAHSHAHAMSTPKAKSRGSAPDLFVEFGHEATMEEITNDDSTTHLSSSFALIAFVGLALHSFVDGLVIFGAFSASEEVGMKVGMAIVVHKLPDGFVLATVVNAVSNTSRSTRNSTLHQLYWLILVCLMTPVGAFFGALFFSDIPPAALSLVLGFGAGTFLFITCSAIIPELFENKQFRLLSFVSFAGGYLSFLIFDSLSHVH